jgi:hypothetical protein
VSRRHRAGALEAIGRLAAQAAQQDRRHVGRDPLGRDPLDLRRVEDRAQHLLVRRQVRPGPLGDEDLPGHEGGGEHVGARVGRLPEAVLGGHVARRADHVAVLRDRRPVHVLRDPEVDQHRPPVPRHDHVVRRDVAVEDRACHALLVHCAVHGAEPLQHSDGEGEGHRQRRWLTGREGPLEHAPQAPALHHLHGEIGAVADLPVLEQAHQVRVTQARGDLGLEEHPAAVLGVSGDLGPDPLEHERRPAPTTTGEEDLTHAAAAEGALELERAEGLTHRVRR